MRHVGELQNHLAVRHAAAFEHADRAAAHQVSPTVGGDQRRHLAAVFLVEGGVGDFNIAVDVGGHGVSCGVGCP
ncbi:hypothetical protein D9M69_638320 [compost metagenome]